MVLFVNELKLRQLLKIPVRYKNPKHHWSVLRKKRSPKDKALEHFDEFYQNVYGDSWENIRAALLNQNHKYMAVVNNFSDTAKIQSDLELLGAINLKLLYNFEKENKQNLKSLKQLQRLNKLENADASENDVVSEAYVSELKSIYRADHPDIDLMGALKSEDANVDANNNKPKEIKLQSIEQELNEVDYDTSRIVDSSVNISLLHEYVPASKIKGMEDWIPESDSIKFYTQAQDFKIEVEKESVLSFPEHLNVYVFDKGNDTRFPSPKVGSTGVLDYFLFNGASILPVLALDIQPKDVVLDMCAAPGGKALAIIQTLVPQILVANDIVASRIKRFQKIIKQYISSIYEIDRIIIITKRDAREIDEKNVYNKILVDVPCTTDRHVLHSEENNLFKTSRIKERLSLPQLQLEILKNALNLVQIGGTVVYSTCTLSPVQNDGVVQMALKQIWEETGSVMIVKDMTEALLPLKNIFKFYNINLKYGHLIVPAPTNNYGPMYFCKIIKVQ